MAKEPSFVYEEDGEVKALVAADITFYLTKFEGAQQGFVKAYEKAIKIVGPHLKWYRTESMKRPKKVTAKELSAFPTWFGPKAASRDQYDITMTSGDAADEVGPYGFQFWMVPATLESSSGFFQLNLPMQMLVEKPEEFAQLVRDLAKTLDFRSGHAGFGIQYDEGDMLDDRDEMQRAWCNRYSGIDCRDLALITDSTKDAIKGVNWITLLDADFAEQLGGIKEIRKQLDKAIRVEEVGAGVYIQAGPRPLLGDRNRKEDMSFYKQVNKLIVPIRISEEIDLPGYDDDSDEWLERFDE